MADSRAMIMKPLKYPDEILSLSMFYSDILSREKAENYVLKHNHGPGSYIVRPNTENDPNFVSISISMAGYVISHVRVYIERSSRGIMYYLLENTKFSTFNDLLIHYNKHRIHCLQGIDDLRLITPIEKVRGNATKLVSVNTKGINSLANKRSQSLESAQQVQTNQDIHCGREKSQTSSLPGPAPHNFSFAGINKSKNMTISRSSSQPESHRENTDNHLTFTNCTNNPVINSDKKASSECVNTLLVKQNPKSVMRRRPPMPLPQDNTICCDTYYSSPRISPLMETSKFHRSNEHGECDLQLQDSVLSHGWTIHCTRDPRKLSSIYFQHEGITTFEIPEEIVDVLTVKQIEFIIRLYCENQQPVPACLKKIQNRVSVPECTLNQVPFLKPNAVESESTETSLSDFGSSPDKKNLISTTIKFHQSPVPESQIKSTQDPCAIESGYETPESLFLSNVGKKGQTLSKETLESNKISASINILSESTHSAVSVSQISSAPQNETAQDPYAPEDSIYEAAESLLSSKTARKGPCVRNQNLKSDKNLDYVNAHSDPEQSTISSSQRLIHHNATVHDLFTTSDVLHQSLNSLSKSSKDRLDQPLPNQNSKSNKNSGYIYVLPDYDHSTISGSQDFVPKNDSVTTHGVHYQNSETLMSEMSSLNLSQPNPSSESNNNLSAIHMASNSVMQVKRPPSFSSIPAVTIPTKAGKPMTVPGVTVSKSKVFTRLHDK